jgi:protocatechuate 3,4-dioxygenase alpha subunit
VSGGLGLTPSQTVGPFLGMGLPWPDGPYVVAEGTPGAIIIGGTLTDGAGDPIPDGLIETWQADPAGRFDHPDDPRGAPAGGTGFRAFGRCATGPDGGYHIITLRPGALPSPDGGTEAPHLDVSVLARGLLDRVVTRIYFSDEAAANAADPVLGSVDPERRDTLIAVAEPGTEGRYRFDIRLQGQGETVFFDV